ncbi:MAG: ABC transporter permease subunit [Longimicrobiales bacterium]|nr:ABC transporter permease subunit [Longimicrobiales bacterium]
MDLRQIWTLFRHEVRCALRERNIVIYSIVLPLVLYPALLWAAFAGISFVQGQSSRMTSRVVILDSPTEHSVFVDSLHANDRFELIEPDVDRQDLINRIARGNLDAVLEFTPPSEGGAALDGNFGLMISFNEARDRSASARSRLESAIEEYRREWVDRERQALGVDDTVWADFLITRDNIASEEDMTRFLLGVLVPMLTLLMVAIASFYPAIDATAGERERSTWETLMSVAAPRSNVAVAKYLYVAVFGMAGGLLNLTALTLSLQWILAPVAGAESVALATSDGIPPSALAVIAVGTALLGLFVAAGMLMFAVFARTFKEGQSMIMPFYFLMIMPALFLQDPDIEFTMQLALIPVANVIMVIRAAITGTSDPLLAATSLGVMSLCVALAIGFAQWVMSSEEVMVGSQEGGLSKFLKNRFTSRKAQA